MNQILELASDILPSLVPPKVTSLVPQRPLATLASFIKSDADPDANRTVPEIIESRGFHSEQYKVTTEDGYILTLHRIVNPFVARKELDAYPILLQHGIAANAAHWLINSDDGYLEPMLDMNDNQPAPANNNAQKKAKRKISNNLGFVLANLGYDVWLGNWRGNRYSMKHKKYSSDNPKFWDFTIDDMIDHDLPSTINFVLQKTGKPTCGYVGMSQGSNIMFGLLATKPEFNDKIKPFIALAPALKISNAIRVPLPVLKYYVTVPDVVKVPALRLVNYALQNTPPGPALPYVEQAIKTFGCGHIFETYLNKMSLTMLQQFYDVNVDPSRLSVYTAQANMALSKKNLAHLIQMNMFEEFSRYDHGDEMNEKLYGSIDPPEYDLKAISNRYIALIYAKNDMWSSVEDVDFISSSLQVPLFEDYLIPDSKWSHYDFTFGKKAGMLVNTKVIEILRKAER